MDKLGLHSGEVRLQSPQGDIRPRWPYQLAGRLVNCSCTLPFLQLPSTVEEQAISVVAVVVLAISVVSVAAAVVTGLPTVVGARGCKN